MIIEDLLEDRNIDIWEMLKEIFILFFSLDILIITQKKSNNFKFTKKDQSTDLRKSIYYLSYKGDFLTRFN